MNNRRIDDEDNCSCNAIAAVRVDGRCVVDGAGRGVQTELTVRQLCAAVIVVFALALAGGRAIAADAVMAPEFEDVAPAANTNTLGKPSELVGNVLLLLLRIDYFDRPEFDLEFEIEIEVTGDVESASITLPDTTTIVLEEDIDRPGFWSQDFLFNSISRFHDLAHGTWMITLTDINDFTSVSTFTLNAEAILDSDVFDTPTVLTPQQDEINVSPCPVFTWIDPTGTAEADILGVGVEFITEEVEQEAVSLFGDIELDAISWSLPLPLMPGENLFGVYYLVFDDASRVSRIDVQSGEMTWLNSVFAPPGYPPSTPLLLIGSETIISFHVSGECQDEPSDCEAHWDNAIGQPGMNGSVGAMAG